MESLLDKFRLRNVVNKMKKIKLVLFLIISIIATGFMDSDVLAIPSINPTTPDEPVSQTTGCVYAGTEGNESFTITFSVQPNNNKGGAVINWVESSHSKIHLLNSFIYAKEFITNGDTITCPAYINYQVNSSAGNKYMKISFRSTYSKQLQLSTEKTRNNNKKFTKNNVSQISTCSYDNGFGGRLYVDAYTDGTVKTYLSTQDHSGFDFEVVAFDTLNSSIFSSSSCPKLGVGYDQVEENGKLKYTIYVSPTGLYDETVFNTKQHEGTLLKTTGDNIKEEQTPPTEPNEPGEGGEIGDGMIDWGDNVDVTCDGIIGEELLGFINKIFKWIRIIAPIIVIIMGSVEFAGAVLQDDKDAIKKASNRFVKRLIVAVALFFIPLLIEFLLNIFNEFSSHSAEICGIGE